MAKKEKKVKELKTSVKKLKSDIRLLVEMFIAENENCVPCIDIVYFEQRKDGIFGDNRLINKGVEVNIIIDLKDE